MRHLFTIDLHNYDPNGTVEVRPSVRGIVIRGGKVLMVHSLKYDYYKFPGGGMEPGENRTEALCREVLEEIGIPLESLRIVKTDWFAKREQLMIGFVGRAKKADFTLSPEVDAVSWVPVEEAPALMHPGKSISTELVRRYLQERTP